MCISILRVFRFCNIKLTIPDSSLAEKLGYECCTFTAKVYANTLALCAGVQLN